MAEFWYHETSLMPQSVHCFLPKRFLVICTFIYLLHKKCVICIKTLFILLFLYGFNVYLFKKAKDQKNHQKKTMTYQRNVFLWYVIHFLVCFVVVVVVLKKCTLNPNRNRKINKIVIHITFLWHALKVKTDIMLVTISN